MRAIISLFLCLYCAMFAGRVLAQAAVVDTMPEVAAAPAPPEEAMGDRGEVNPARYYWQASAAYYAVPLATRTRWSEFCTQHPVTAPDLPREELGQIFQDNAFERTLALTRKGAEQSHIPDWGVDYSQGFSAPLPHLAEIRGLMRLLLYHARYEQYRGNTDDAIADLLGLFRTARQLTRQGTYSLIDLLVQKKLELQGIEVTALLLTGFTPEQLRLLSGALAALPPGSTLAQGMLFEKRCVVQAITQLSQQYAMAAVNPELRAGFAQHFAQMMGDTPGSWLQDTLADPELPAAFAQRYEVIGIALALPPSHAIEALHAIRQQDQQAEQQCAAEIKRLTLTLPLVAEQEQFSAEGLSWARRHNPALAQQVEALLKQTPVLVHVLGGALTGDYGKIYQTAAHTDAEWALLRAGLLLRAEGELVLPEIADPFIPKTYSLQHTAKGFRLTSAFRLDDEPVSLSFGD